MRFEGAVFAVEGAFGGASVAQHEVVLFDLLGSPVVWGGAVDAVDEFVVLTGAAHTGPIALRGAKNELGFERVFEGLKAIFPTVEDDEPAFFGFDFENESFRSGAVLQSVESGSTATCLRGGAAAAAVAFFAWGFGIFKLFRRRGGRCRQFLFCWWRGIVRTRRSRCRRTFFGKPELSLERRRSRLAGEMSQVVEKRGERFFSKVVMGKMSQRKTGNRKRKMGGKSDLTKRTSPVDETNFSNLTKRTSIGFVFSNHAN